MNREPAGSLCAAQQPVRRAAREEHPVPRFQNQLLTAYLKLGGSAEQDDPLVVVLVVVNRLVEFAAQDLFDDRFAHLDKLLNPLATRWSDRAVQEPTTGRSGHRLEATPPRAALQRTGGTEHVFHPRWRASARPAKRASEPAPRRCPRGERRADHGGRSCGGASSARACAFEQLVPEDAPPASQRVADARQRKDP